MLSYAYFQLACALDGNRHVSLLVLMLMWRVLPGIFWHSSLKIANASLSALRDIVAAHVPSVRIAVCPPTVEGLHGGGVTVVVQR